MGYTTYESSAQAKMPRQGCQTRLHKDMVIAQPVSSSLWSVSYAADTSGDRVVHVDGSLTRSGTKVGEDVAVAKH